MTTATPAGTTAAAKKTAAPRRPAGHTTSGAAPAGRASQTSIEQHLSTIAEGNVMDPQGLYEFLEAVRALSSGVAFFVHAAASQIEAAARKGARDNTDGRMTPRQKIELALALRKMGRLMENNIAEDYLAAAKGAVKTYAVMEAFLESLESDQTSRPHRNTKGGFNPFGGS